MPRAVRILHLVLLLVVLAYAATTIPGVRRQPGFDPLLDGWVQCLGYVLVAALAVLRPFTSRVHRVVWVLVAVGLVLRSAGFLVYVPFIRTMQPLPYPSPADALWLSSSVVLVIALGVAVRVHSARLSLLLALDAVLGALVTFGVALAFLYPTLLELSPATAPRHVVMTNLAYPLLDVAMLVVVVGGVLALKSWTSPSLWLLATGAVLFAVTDSVFVFQVSAGSYRPGTWISALSLVAGIVMAMAAWVPEGDPQPTEEPVPGFLFTALAALVGTLLLVAAELVDLPALPVLLGGAGIVVAIVRGSLTILGDRTVAGDALRAKNAELLRFQALVESSNDFIAMARIDGTVTYVNPGGRRLVGLDPDTDVTGSVIADYLTEEALRLSVEVELPAVFEHGHWEGESTLLDRRGGPPIPVAISSFLVLHPVTQEPMVLATVQRDITERIVAHQELQALADERRWLLGRLVRTQEDERSRIAANVHDDSIQALAAAQLRLQLLNERVHERAPELRDLVDPTLASVSAAMNRLRHLIFDLESPEPRADLRSSVSEAAAFLFEHGPQWRLTGDDDLDLPHGLRVTAYRIVKEALTNVRKHAQATRVEIDLRATAEGVTVSVSDDGRGITAEDLRIRPGHLGYSHMRDRAAVAGGWVSVERRPQGGTQVLAWLPMVDADEPE